MASATPLWIKAVPNATKAKAPPLSAHSKFFVRRKHYEFFSNLLTGRSLPMFCVGDAAVIRIEIDQATANYGSHRSAGHSPAMKRGVAAF